MVRVVASLFALSTVAAILPSFGAWANSTASSCDCFNSCLCKDWDCCCQCGDCTKDPDVTVHCGSALHTCSIFAIAGAVCSEARVPCHTVAELHLNGASVELGSCIDQGFVALESKQKTPEGIETSQYARKQNNASTLETLTGDCNCFNTCLCKDWDCCCHCNECASDPQVAPHCASTLAI